MEGIIDEPKLLERKRLDCAAKYVLCSSYLRPNTILCSTTSGSSKANSNFNMTFQSPLNQVLQMSKWVFLALLVFSFF